MRSVLTIAGSDSIGGAGIQADIKTMIMNGVYAMSAITALTAQNTTGVFGIFESSPEFLAKQIDAVFSDIRPDAVKIGMIQSCELAEVVVANIKKYAPQNIVIDPVMACKNETSLSNKDAVDFMKINLYRFASVLTPNIPEAQILSGIKINSDEDLARSAKIISGTCGCSVLCKGGHMPNNSNDVLYCNGEYTWFYGEHIDNPNTHGTGCTLSSAIASNLAKGLDLIESIKHAKEYLSSALRAMLDLGKGNGPIDHAFLLKNNDM